VNSKNKNTTDESANKIAANSNQIRGALNLIRRAKQILKAQDVIRHEKAIHCELAEWVIEKYLDGNRATLGNQKGWDIELNDGIRIQVKSHAKARTNLSNWTTLSKHSEGVSEIFVVVFTADYFIMQIFQINVDEAYRMCNKKREITWKRLEKAGKILDLSLFKKKFPFLFTV
jgi:hypothetical protein